MNVSKFTVLKPENLYDQTLSLCLAEGLFGKDQNIQKGGIFYVINTNPVLG